MQFPHSPPRRGIAMMLVLISLMMGTVLAVSFLSSRDNSTAIGENTEAAAAAKWTALTGLEIGLAILETQIDWRTLHTSGSLVSNYAVGGGTINIDLVDIVTGLPPTADSRQIQITISSTVNGLEQIAVATAIVGETTPDVVDLDLSEFAVFCNQGILLNNNATITRWTAAPSSRMGKRIAVGSRSTAAFTVDLNLNSSCIDTTVFESPGSSPSLVTNDNGPAIDQFGLADLIPFPASPTPPTAPPPVPSLAPDLAVNSNTLITADARYQTISTQVRNVEVTLQGNITLTADSLFWLQRDTGLLINGAVNLVVYGNLQLDRGAYIELMPGASLTMFVAGNALIDDAYLGEERLDKMVFDNSGDSPPFDLNRLLIYDFDDGSATPKAWVASRKAVIKGQLYAPSAIVTLMDQAALYGRVAANAFVMIDNSVLYYDHALDAGGGYTDPSSSIYDAGGRIKTDINSLSRLDDSDYQLLADALNLIVKTKNSTIYYNGYTAPIPVDPPPGDPTPRPVVVESQLLSFGSNLSGWESGKIPVKVATVSNVLDVRQVQ